MSNSKRHKAADTRPDKFINYQGRWYRITAANLEKLLKDFIADRSRPLNDYRVTGLIEMEQPIYLDVLTKTEAECFLRGDTVENTMNVEAGIIDPQSEGSMTDIIG